MSMDLRAMHSIETMVHMVASSFVATSDDDGGQQSRLQDNVVCRVGVAWL